MRPGFASDGWLRLIILALLSCALALRLHELARQNIWWDEARNIDVALRPFRQIAAAPELDIQPPVYYWLLHGWGRLMGLGVQPDISPELLAYAMRFASVWAGVVAVALVFVLARRFGQAAALAAATVSAFSPFWLAESQETRMYTVGFALLAAAAVAWLAAFDQFAARDAEQPGPIGKRATMTLICFVVLSGLALLVHYNSAFVLAAWYSAWGIWALLRTDRRRQLAILAIGGAATVVLVAPVAPIALRQITGYANPNLVVPSVGDYLWQNWQAYAGGYAFDPSLLGGYGVTWLWATLGLSLLGIVLYGAIRSQRIKDAADGALGGLLVWLAGSLILYYIAVVDRGAFHVRYASFVTPALYALIGVAVAGWTRLWRPLGLGVFVLIAVALAPAVHADLYDSRFAREDIAGVTGWLRDKAGPDDVIFVDQKYPFGLYYRRYAIEGNALPQGPEAAPARYLFVDINTIDKRLNEWAAGAHYLFWVQWFESDTDPRRSVAFLLDKEGQRAGEQWFQGYSVDWWELDPPNHFELAENMTAARFLFADGPTFTGAVETMELSLPTEPLSPGDKAPVVVRWKRAPEGVVSRPLKARVALYSSDGWRVAQNDQRILNDRHLLPAEWDFTDTPLNVYMLDAPPDAQPGTYMLRLLVYDADTLEPLTLLDDANNPAGQEATLGTVEILAATD
jgi:hypothetical protein